MEEAIYSFIAGVSGGVPIAVPLFIYLHNSMKCTNDLIKIMQEDIKSQRSQIDDVKGSVHRLEGMREVFTAHKV